MSAGTRRPRGAKTATAGIVANKRGNAGLQTGTAAPRGGETARRRRRGGVDAKQLDDAVSEQTPSFKHLEDSF